MPHLPRAAVPALFLLLAACAGDAGQGPAAGNPETRPLAGRANPVEACGMRGALAEDRAVGPVGDLSIDSALLRAQVTEACLRGTPVRQSPAGPPTPFLPG